MNKEAQRIAIAESQNWQFNPYMLGDSKYLEVINPAGRQVYCLPYHIDAIPNYLEDLNLMRIVLGTMTDEQAEVYESELLCVLIEHEECEHLWFADADIHGETYLRVTGKWVD